MTDVDDNGNVPRRSVNGVIRALVSLAFRMLPRAWRFRAAVVFARAVRPLVARTRAYAVRCELKTDGLPETTLDLILGELTRQGVIYDPVVEVVGLELLPRSAEDGPCIVLGAHMMLSTLFVRRLVDEGIEAATITAETDMRIPGTREPAKVILAPSRGLLFDVRRCLRDGVVVCGMVDRELLERRTSPVETANGQLLVSTALFRVALRTGARIVFIGSRMRDDDTVVITLQRAEETTPHGLAAELAGFVDQLLRTTTRTSHPRRSSGRTTATRG